LGANFSLLAAGTCIVWASDLRKGLASTGSTVDPWQVSLNWMMLMVVVSALMILGIYWWINRYVLTDTRFYDQNEQKAMKKSKPKMSLKDSLMFLLKSRYMLCVAIIVIAYGVSINLVEVTWKGQLKLAYPTPNEYSIFMGNFSRMTGVATILMMFFVTGNVVRKLGWRIAALITPVVLLVTGAGFFGFMLFGDMLKGFVAYLGTTPLMMAVVFGTIQNIASKSSKYSLFDPTKEMTYIPLDQEYKVKGKAAIDVVGARFGKSGGAFIQQVLILGFGSIAAITPYIGIILFIIIFAWLLAANNLSKLFAVASAEKDARDAEAAAKKKADAADTLARSEAVRT